MKMKEHAAKTAAAIETALETYCLDRLALRDAEQMAALARESEGTDPEEPTPSLGELRASVKTQQRELIRLQNDQFRITLSGGEIYVTSGVQGRGGTFVHTCLEAVRGFTTFSEENDPYGEHDFGIFEIEGQKVYWKIDAYDRERRYGSEDPADPELTTRVLTLLLPEEY